VLVSHVLRAVLITPPFTDPGSTNGTCLNGSPRYLPIGRQVPVHPAP
jgi:hypothetical protein